MADATRCPWAINERAAAYHDEEWGVPQRDDRVLFEFLILEGAQAGLSWDTILAKRERYREVFDGFDAQRIARYDRKKVRALLADPGIVRNRLKVESAIVNARAYLEVRAEFRGEGGFARFMWGLVGGAPLTNAWETLAHVPASTPTSDRMSKELKRRGFKFAGSTICYALMQATGMVNDHLVGCPRHAEAKKLARGWNAP